jgi:nicotinamide-nucleotide amidase
MEESKVVRAGVVVTGTEVITGRISDANGPWVSEQLADLGVEVAHIIIVADRPDDLEGALRFLAAEGMDLIVTSGGLGPTADDLTAEIVGRFAGRPLQLDLEMEEKIAGILRRFAKRRNWKIDEAAMMDANRKQAMVPEGAQTLDPVGTAPGLVVPVGEPGERVVIVLPGPPRELQPMWPRALETDAVRAILDRATPLHGLTMRMFGVPESEIAKSLREIEDDDGVDVEAVEVTTCLRKGEIEIDVRWRDETEAVAMAVRDGLQRRHRPETFSLDGETIDEQVAELLREKGVKLGLAESCSGGMLAARITNPPGASDYFLGSIVSYSYAAKEELLGVPKALLDEKGAVSPEVAEAMAKGALERFGADVAVAITGIAGPGGGSIQKPVGTVVFARAERGADPSHVVADERLFENNGRGGIRLQAALCALELLMPGAPAPEPSE